MSLTNNNILSLSFSLHVALLSTFPYLKSTLLNHMIYFDTSYVQYKCSLAGLPLFHNITCISLR